MDYDEVAKMVIAGRTFDNGVLCTCEQNVICPKDKVDEMVAALRANGAYYIDNQADADKMCIRDSSKAAIPFLAAMFVCLLLIAYIEPISMALVWLLS